MKKIAILFLALTVAFTLGACCLRHEWTEATCTEPRTCTVCGATEGEALGHEWAEATCTEPRTCTVCGAAEGKALGHEWAEATYTHAATCIACGETEGEPLNPLLYINKKDGVTITGYAIECDANFPRKSTGNRSSPSASTPLTAGVSLSA